MFNLISGIEYVFLYIVCTKGVYPNVLYDVLREIADRSGKLELVGCSKHSILLTKCIINLFVITRGFFLVKAFNKYHDQGKTKTKELRKQGKY